MGKKTTLEEFVAKSKEIHGEDKYNYEQVKLTSMMDEVKIQCKEHQLTFLVKPSQHINKRDKTGCPQCSNISKTNLLRADTEDIIKIFNEIHGEGTYDYTRLKEQYKGKNAKVEIKCNKCNEWFSIKPGAHQFSKQGCRTCGYKNRIIPHKKTQETYIQQFIDAHADKNYDISGIEYKDNKTHIQYFCFEKDKHGLVHGIISQLPQAALDHGCYHCNGRGPTKYTEESFIRKANAVHNKEKIIYTYEKLGLTNVTEDINVYCHKCNSYFTQNASRHLNGDGCKKCNGGVPYTQEEFIQKAKRIHPEIILDKSIYKGSHELTTFTCPKHGDYAQTAYMFLQTIHGCPKCAHEIDTSAAQREIFEFISYNCNYEIKLNDRENIGKQEIDIYIPELKLGIEFHGNYWHCEKFVGRKYHIQKLEKALEKNIKLIQIFEHEWYNKKDIVKSRILYFLKAIKPIRPNKTKLVEVDKKKATIFFEENHLQGSTVSCEISYGLEYNNELISCMSFGKSRFNKNYQWELLRFCSKLNTSVRCGASKLLKEFRKNYQGNIVSYADRRWSNGELYLNLGFEKEGESQEGYFYYNIKDKTIHNRMMFQKQNLTDMQGYDDKLTEYEIMQLNGYDRIWDAGQLRFVLR